MKFIRGLFNKEGEKGIKKDPEISNVDMQIEAIRSRLPEGSSMGVDEQHGSGANLWIRKTDGNVVRGSLTIFKDGLTEIDINDEELKRLLNPPKEE